MKTYSNTQLFARLSQKGISYKGYTNVFDNYSYFQLVNAYKPVFIERAINIEGIEKIINERLEPHYSTIVKNFNVHSATEKFDFILVRLQDKYNFGYTRKEILSDQGIRTSIIEKLKKMNYQMHVYKEGTHIKDFVHILKFEHELRNVLLKYCLILEETIKSEFVNYLNSEENIESTFLLDAKNYNINEKQQYAIKSMSLAVEGIHSEYLLSMKRKIDQNILPPYWMSIPSFVLNGVIKTIDNLNRLHSRKIKEKLFYKLTNLSEEDYIGSDGLIDTDELNIHSDMIFRAISDVGEFRNALAHNSPIFIYNIRDSSHLDSIIDYRKPSINNNKSKNAIATRKTRATGDIRNLEFLLNCSHPNLGNNNEVSMDLSYNIFLIKNFMCSIDNNCLIKEELKDVFCKYNIFDENIQDEKYFFLQSELDKCHTDLADYVEELNNINILEINDLVRDNKPSTRVVQQKNRRTVELAREINKTLSEVKKIGYTNKSSYSPFVGCDKYYKYTGINYNFIKEL